MVIFFEKCYNGFPDYQPDKPLTRIYSLMRFLVQLLANVILVLYYKSTACLNRGIIEMSSKVEERIIVSLTSYPARINKVWMVIESIMHQKKKPDIIVLWLSRNQFPSVNHVPSNLRKLTRRGLKIEIVDDDIRSHKKYYYVIQKYPNDAFVTIDDDILYREDFIENIIAKHREFPNAIISNYYSEITYDDNDNVSPYSNWIKSSKHEYNLNNLFFGSGGGTYFPPKSLSTFVTDIDAFMAFCKNADDVWLNAMAKINNTAIIPILPRKLFLPVIDFSDNKLCIDNINNGQNDVAIKKTIEYCLTKTGKNPFTN